MKSECSILSVAKGFTANKEYKKALSCYRLFKIVNEDLADIVRVNESFLQKKIKGNSDVNKIIMEIPVFDNMDYTLECFWRVIKNSPFDVRVDIIQGTAEKSYLLAWFDMDDLKEYRNLTSTNSALYIKCFLKETRFFDTQFYQNQYKPTLDGLDALTHFIQYGLAEGKLPARWFDLHVGNSQKISKIVSEAVHDRVSRTTCPKISVLVPVYNNAQYLHECIGSIVNQTLEDIEIIIINDGSTDQKAIDILQGYAEKDARIRLIHKKNTGYGHSMNCGLYSATGLYISIIESDDYILPTMYEKLFSNIENENVDFIKSDFYIFTGFGDSRIFTLRKLTEDISFYNKVIDIEKNLSVFSLNNINCNGIYSKKFIDTNSIVFHESPGASFQDNGFWFQTMMHGKKAMFLAECFLCVRRDNESSSVFSKDKVFCMCHEYAYIENIIRQKNQLVDKYIHIFNKKKWSGYMFTLGRIASEKKDDFIKHISKEFYDAYRKGELKESLFSAKDFTKIMQLIEKYKNTLKVKKDYEYFKNLNPEDYQNELEGWFKRVTGKDLNLSAPQTFNEKIQWLKLNDSSPTKTLLADKYLAREWVKKRIGEKYLIPLLGVWEQFDDIDFSALPRQFVLKANHGCGWNIIVSDIKTFDISSAREKFNTWMKKNYAFSFGLELQYKDIPPRIIAEKYISEIGENIYDYRFFCFNGEPYHIWVDIMSGTPHHRRNIFDTGWNKIDLKVTWPNLEKDVPAPQNLDEMIRLSRKLSADFSFVRVDFYEVDGMVYFGEMTFTPQSGVGKWEPEFFNLSYGNLINLNNSIKVSVIVPTYNSEKYLKSCIDSIREQTLRDIEIICIDDGSIDDSINILNESRYKDSRIKVLRQENLGTGSARNRGLEAAGGEYLFFADSDDFFEKDLLEKLYSQAKREQSDFVVCLTDLHCMNSGTIKECSYSLSKEVRRLPYPFNWKNITGNIFRSMMGWAFDKLYKKTFIKNNEIKFQEIRIHNDMNFVFSTLLKAERISIVHQVLVHKRTGLKNQLTNSKQVYWRHFIDALFQLKQNCVDYGLYCDVENSYINYVIHICSYYNNSLKNTLQYSEFCDIMREYMQQRFRFDLISEDIIMDKSEFRTVLEIIK